ncbi:hypothetical protein CAP36_06860 [Chitinophagaceae bacterium IBVUCB2]|nr:hypothetical protein CAP36_06860 [Chitinophagaceae bacterium IBVUCB2]
MRKNTWIPLAVLTIIMVAGFFILQSATPTKSAAPIKKQEQALCSKLNTTACTPIQKANAPGEMIVESLSRQFLSITGFIR